MSKFNEGYNQALNDLMQEVDNHLEKVSEINPKGFFSRLISKYDHQKLDIAEHVLKQVIKDIEEHKKKLDT